MYRLIKLNRRNAMKLCKNLNIKYQEYWENDVYSIKNDKDIDSGIIVYTLMDNELNIEYFEVVNKKSGIGGKIIEEFIAQQQQNGIKKITLTALSNVKGFWIKMGFRTTIEYEMEKDI